MACQTRVNLQQNFQHIYRQTPVCYTNVIPMTDTDKILQAIEELKAGQRALQSGQKALQETVEQQGKVLNGRMDTQEHKMDTLELKVEAFHSEQTKANEEITNLIYDSNEA